MTAAPTDEELAALRGAAGGMNPFTYESLPGRVVFGPGRVAEVRAEVESARAVRGSS